ncbi:hypothetical protein P691DRAFT_298191 [Macrolepiota fuliginosa MF-IS2]|uniref:Uncharacterized protein n=1 Tax=Macrolepiota fuliginosa MF-IS2 TaxID=1400762 RepID=A0A9P5X5R0_9AGAR|nr:hypothetical protein P691DRAFT_298191 [Macrolepiota fuliginosa MF-IS2]
MVNSTPMLPSPSGPLSPFQAAAAPPSMSLPQPIYNPHDQFMYTAIGGMLCGSGCPWLTSSPSVAQPPTRLGPKRAPLFLWRRIWARSSCRQTSRVLGHVAMNLWLDRATCTHVFTRSGAPNCRTSGVGWGHPWT